RPPGGGRGGGPHYSASTRRTDPNPGRPHPAPRGGVERLAEERFSEQERLRLGALEQMRQAEQR
ncbi:hypothetical protein QCC12_23025, partial [Pseudomonas aeruginosa]|nr:hypothetical protein [Pseudomonas aeruginosa]